MRDPFDDDDDAEAARNLPPPTLPISEILADVDRRLADSPIESSQNLPPPTLPISEILADVDRQLVDHPLDVAPLPDAEGSSTNADTESIAKMDAHVRSILAGNSTRVFILNTALGHNLPLLPLTENAINKEVAEMYACYYGHSSDDDEDEAETEMQWLINNPTQPDSLTESSSVAPPPSTLRPRAS
jgi:hypothetical protein